MYKFILNKVYFFFKKEAILGELAHNTRKFFFIIIVLVFSLLFFFKPFLLNLLLIKTQLILSIGCSILAAMGYIIAISIFMPFNKKKWTVLMEFTTVMTAFFFGWLLIYGYLMICFKVNLPEPFIINEPIVIPENFFYKTLFYTLGTGSFVYIILYMYNIIKFDNGKNIFETNISNNILNETYKNPKTLKLNGKNKNEQLIINRNDFICAKSEGHYIKVYYLHHKSQRVNNYVLRNTMKNFEHSIIDYNTLYRCHKSFFININYLKSIIGNSNKSHIYIKHYPNRIPISKHKIKYLKDILKKFLSDS